MSRRRLLLYTVAVCVLVITIMTMVSHWSMPRPTQIYSSDSEEASNEVLLSPYQTQDSQPKTDSRYVRIYKGSRDKPQTTQPVKQNNPPRKMSTQNKSKKAPVVKPITTKKQSQYRLAVRQKEVGKRQRHDVDNFCKLYKLEKQKFVLPHNLKNSIYTKLLPYNRAKTIFCVAPKVGSTSLVVLYYIAQGLLPESKATVKRSEVTHTELQQLVTDHSFANLSSKQRMYAVKRYFKFVMYRNPLERLASAYRSKIERYPLVGYKDMDPHYNWLRKKIYQHTRPMEYMVWKKGGQKDEVYISFSDFVTFWLTTNDYNSKHDPHFVPIFELCQPCQVRYSYYGDFKNFEEDANVLIRQIGTTPLQLRDGFYASNQNASTSNVASSLFEQLTVDQKLGLLERLAQDIDFYYHIFPSEKDSHKEILQLDKNLPVPY